MGQENNVMNEYLGNTRRFADFWNGILFQGESMIRP